MIRLSRLDTPERRALAATFLRFAIVGASGVPVDIAVVYILKTSLGLYWAGACSYLVAATWTFAFNRLWTFAAHTGGSLFVQWLRFLGANLSGLLLNRGLYVLLIATSATCRDYPFLAVGFGALAGMFANFAATRRLVFRRRMTTPT